MSTATKYVGLDVHQATTVAAVREANGRLIARTVVPTEASALLALVRGMRGAVHVTFEEGTQAQWLADLLRPEVDRVLVCNRRGQTSQGNKGDHADAAALADLLRHGALRAVYHDAGARAALKELARTYLNVVEDSTRVMLRLKALFRAISKAGTPSMSSSRTSHPSRGFTRLQAVAALEVAKDAPLRTAAA